MQKILLSHFYNEEYLLPWFLNHHKKIFDHGIMIDYNSTDRSRKIIQEICPTWDIITSRNKTFDPFAVDAEVMDYEKYLDGWRVCLNVTEHLVGDYSILDDTPEKQICMPSFVFADDNEDLLPTYDRPLYEQKTWGFFENWGNLREARSIHNYPIVYNGAGRHFQSYQTPVKLAIFYYGFCPWNEFQLQRKMQIQNKIPESSVQQNLGLQHIGNRENFEDRYRTHVIPRAKYVTDEIAPFIADHLRCIGEM